MCEIFISADVHGYESRTRSVRLHGVVTSIRLENLFWDVLGEIAARDGLSVVQLIEKLHDELMAARGEAGNFASFLRVSALRYEALVAHGGIPADPAVPLRSLDAQVVLQHLPGHALEPHDPASGLLAGARPLAAAAREQVQGQLTTQASAFSTSARACAAVKSSAPV